MDCCRLIKLDSGMLLNLHYLGIIQDDHKGFRTIDGSWWPMTENDYKKITYFCEIIAPVPDETEKHGSDLGLPSLSLEF